MFGSESIFDLTDLDVEQVLKRAHLALRGRCDARLAEYGLTLPQVEVLGRLWRGQADCLRDLGARLGTQPATLTGVLDGLERRGLVRRTEDSADARIKRLRLTAAGQQLKERVTSAYGGVQERALQGFTSEEVETLKDWLARIVRNLEGAAPSTPLWDIV